MQPNQIDLGSAAVATNIIALMSYMTVVIASLVLMYYIGKFVYKEYKANRLVENRLLASVGILLFGTLAANGAHLYSRISYTLETGQIYVPFGNPTTTWVFTVGHLLLALTVVNLLVVFFQDTGVCWVSRAESKKEDGKNAIQERETT